MTLKSGQVWADIVACKNSSGELTAPTVGPAGALYVNGVANAASVTVTGSNPYAWSVTLPVLAPGDIVSLYMTATLAGFPTGGVIARDTADTKLVSDLNDAAVAPTVGDVASAVWTSVDRQLTALDEDVTTIDLDATAVGSVTGDVGGNVVGSVGSVAGDVGGNVVGSVASVTGAVGSVTGDVGGNVVGSVASVTGAVGSVTGDVGGNVVGSVASVTGAVGSVTVVSDKAGYALASTGLDAVSTTAPAGVAGNFREMIVQLWRRQFKKATMTATQLKTYDDAETGVLTTQPVSDDGTTQTMGAAS